MNITLKNIPAVVYQALKARAKANHRSINSEVLYSLRTVLGLRETAELNHLLEQARAVRGQIAALSGGQRGEVG